MLFDLSIAFISSIKFELYQQRGIHADLVGPTNASEVFNYISQLSATPEVLSRVYVRHRRLSDKHR